MKGKSRAHTKCQDRLVVMIERFTDDDKSVSRVSES